MCGYLLLASRGHSCMCDDSKMYLQLHVYKVNVVSENYMYYVSSIGKVDRYQEFRKLHPPSNVFCCPSGTSCKAVTLSMVLLIDISLFVANVSRNSLRVM